MRIAVQIGLICLIGLSLNATATDHWCGKLLESPLTGEELSEARATKDKIEELDRRIHEFDVQLNKLTTKFQRRRLNRERHELWLEKVELRKNLLHKIDYKARKDTKHYLLVKGILDAHISSIEALRNYLKELNRVRYLSRIALSAESLDFLSTLFMLDYSRVFTFVSIGAVTLHTYEVATVKTARAKVEESFARIQELLAVYDAEMGKTYPVLKMRGPYGVLTVALLNGFNLNSYLEEIMDPFPPTDVLSAVNSFRLMRNLRIIKKASAEVREVSEWLSDVSSRMEREFLEEVVQPGRGRKRTQSSGGI